MVKVKITMWGGPYTPSKSIIGVTGEVNFNSLWNVIGVTQNDEIATNRVILFDFVQFDWYHSITYT